MRSPRKAQKWLTDWGRDSACFYQTFDAGSHIQPYANTYSSCVLLDMMSNNWRSRTVQHHFALTWSSIFPRLIFMTVRLPFCIALRAAIRAILYAVALSPKILTSTSVTSFQASESLKRLAAFFSVVFLALGSWLLRSGRFFKAETDTFVPWKKLARKGQFFFQISIRSAQPFVQSTRVDHCLNCASQNSMKTWHSFPRIKLNCEVLWFLDKQTLRLAVLSIANNTSRLAIGCEIVGSGVDWAAVFSYITGITGTLH